MISSFGRLSSWLLHAKRLGISILRIPFQVIWEHYKSPVALDLLRSVDLETPTLVSDASSHSMAFKYCPSLIFLHRLTGTNVVSLSYHSFVFKHDSVPHHARDPAGRVFAAPCFYWFHGEKPHYHINDGSQISESRNWSHLLEIICKPCNGQSARNSEKLSP